MSKRCPDCVYFNSPDSTCRLSAPTWGLEGDTQITHWPVVATADWCAEGYNPTDGFYDPSPRVQ